MKNMFKFTDAHRNYFRSHGQKVDYRKKQLIVWSVDDTPWVYFVDSGLVKASCLYENGTESILGYFIPGQTFAQSGSFFDHSGGADLEFSAVESSVVYRVTREQFFEQLTSDQKFNQDYLTMLLRNQLALTERTVYLGESALSKRCVRWLLFMAKFFGQHDGKACSIVAPLTQDTAAAFLNVTRESAGKCLRKLSQTGYIKIEKKQMTIADVHKLRSLL